MTTSPAGANNNSSGGEGDDARKKRGNSQDEREAFKKVRSEKKTEDNEGIGNASASLHMESNKTALQQHTTQERSKAVDSTTITSAKNPPRVWDLESAILYLAQIGNAGGKRKSPDISLGNPKKSVDTIETNTREAAATTEKAKKETTAKEESVDEKTSPVIREYLTNDKTSWITFRAAHAGDASTIAQWYRKQRAQDQRKSKQEDNETRERVPPEEPELEKPLRPSSSNEEEALSDRRRRPNSSNDAATLDNDDVEEETAVSSLQLEHWLAEGLGDENTCPFVHGLLAYVHKSGDDENDDDGTDTDSNPSSPTVSTKTLPPTRDENNKASHHLAAVVLMSLSWAFGKRTLKIEWMSIGNSFPKEEGMALRHKVWLRIHTLSAMTACQAISVDQQVLLSASEESEEQQEPLEAKGSPRKSDFVEPSAE